MRADEAARSLADLESETGQKNEGTFIEWRSKTAAVLRAAFGATSVHYKNFVLQTEVRNEGYTAAKGRHRDLEFWRQDAVSRGKAEIRAAVYMLETLRHERPLDDMSIDPELWSYVQGLIADNDWAKIPAAVAIFVEDKLRSWAGDPRNAKSETLVGKGLYTQVLNSSGLLRLGNQTSESEGWMSLGTGLAQAVGNVDRHRIQQRADVRRYAMGVLGLGSLLLTQLRYEHPAQVQEAAASTPQDNPTPTTSEGVSPPQG